MFTALSRQPCEQTGFRILYKMPTIVTFVFLLLSIAVIVTITLVQVNRKEVLSPGLKYGIVLDAGSSRTTVYVYEWPAEKENDTGVVSQTFKCSVKGRGISSYGSNPRELAKPINDCMDKVKETIPFHLHRSTPVYLGATAGMRLLRLQNETTANDVLESVQNYFTSQPFEFRGAQIITGQEEGVYGWITANYLMGNFLEKNIWSAWVHPHGAETTGALDLGGASTQISFIPEETTKNSNYSRQVELYGYKYSVYTHSFQCYGRDEAEKKLLALMLQAFSGFYYTVNALNLTGQFSLADFNSSMWTFCAQNWDQLPFILPKFDETYARSYCFSANYIYYLLVHGYKFNAETWPQIHFQKEVGSSSIAWSLGYMLSLTNMIPPESDQVWFPMNPSLFAGLLLFFTAVALLCLIFLVYSCVVSRMRKNSCHVEHVFAVE